MLYMDNITASTAVGISVVVGFIVAIIVQLIFVPWQRREITGNTLSGPVKFTINESSESTPSGSPKRKQRPSSHIQSDTKLLPAITEQTELTSFNNLSGVNPCLYPNDKTQQNGGRTPSITNGNYKIDSKIIEKAENLLSSHRSLDNTDLTITSLNYIDEHHQQQNGYLRSANQSEPLHSYFDNQHHRQLSPNTKHW